MKTLTDASCYPEKWLPNGTLLSCSFLNQQTERKDMTEQDYRLLEILLGKLHLELQHDFCIVPNHIQDGYYIALYNGSGERFKDLQGPSLKDIVDRYQNEPIEEKI